ncbi:hypothetical protein [Brucella anthropi]|uniref:hypothetical protein n=1 Tax=Brucella anthropi TaxID=529 RepID=UPI000F665A76|nr:hypothetical protein [Brucella anthropi]RRY08832.1 hypothetical protein EGJ58_13105 [Brucella anthropi]
MKAMLKIVQIAVELEDGSFGVVALKSDYMQMLLPMLEALSEGPIRVLPVPAMQAIPIEKVR